MPVECYAKVIQPPGFVTASLTSSEIMYLRYHNRAKIEYKKAYYWFCHLRLTEYVEKIDIRILKSLKYLPGFRWEILSRCVDISWYESVGGMFDWEDVPEVCSYLSQEELTEDSYIPILPFGMCILRSLIVAHEEISCIFPECFQEDNVMPTDLLADYIRDRLGSSL